MVASSGFDMGGRFLCRHFIVLPGWQILACLFPYIGWFLWLIKMDGVSTGCRRSDGFGFGWAISRNTFVGKEILYTVFWASERWMDACARWDWDCYIGLYPWIGCFGMDFTGETKEVMIRMGMVRLDTMSVNLRNESAL